MQAAKLASKNLEWEINDEDIKEEVFAMQTWLSTGLMRRQSSGLRRRGGGIATRLNAGQHKWLLSGLD